MGNLSPNFIVVLYQAFQILMHSWTILQLCQLYLNKAENKNKMLLLYMWKSNNAIYIPKGFYGSSIGKESTCNAEDPSLIPGSGKSTGKG